MSVRSYGPAALLSDANEDLVVNIGLSLIDGVQNGKIG